MISCSSNKLDETKVKKSIESFSQSFCTSQSSFYCKGIDSIKIGPVVVENHTAKVSFETAFRYQVYPGKLIVKVKESEAVFKKDQKGDWYMMTVNRPLGLAEIKNVQMKIE